MLKSKNYFKKEKNQTISVKIMFGNATFQTRTLTGVSGGKLKRTY